MYNYFISIIIPAYNTEKYISSCLESVLKQKYENFEIIIVNDGSSDNTDSICRLFQENDQRIKYFEKENGGVSSARNLGLSHAHGDWVCFIDSDDVVSETYLTSLTENIHNNSSLVFCNYQKEFEKTLDIGNVYAEKEDMIKYFLRHLTALSGPYAKLYSMKVINKYHIRFPENVHMGEDAIFILRYLNKVDSIAVSNSLNYIVKKRKASLSTKYNNFQSEWSGYILWKREMEHLLQKYEGIFENEKEILWNHRIGDAFYRCLQCIYKSNTNLKTKEKITLLKSIPQAEYAEYEKYYHAKHKLQKINKFLICNKQFYLFYYLGCVHKFIVKKKRS